MKKIVLLALIALTSFSIRAQTSKELIGKWQLVKFTKNGKNQDIKDKFKSDQVFQLFKEDNKFTGIVGDKSTNGKWKLSKENDALTVTVNLIPVKFEIDYFDSKKRIISNYQIGTLEYKKIDD